MRRCKNKHRHMIPTIYYGKLGYMWCKDCGAIRDIKKVEDGRFEPSEPKWHYPNNAKFELMKGWKNEG